MPDPNHLYYGDNLEVLRRYLPDNSVDLIYLDPPFNSRPDYNVLFAEKDGSRSASQITAFKDTWEWNLEAERTYQEVVEAGGRTADALRAFRTLLGGTDMLAYLAMMAPRLVELRRVLKETGSIYLHCDPTASHYLNGPAAIVVGGAVAGALAGGLNQAFNEKHFCLPCILKAAGLGALAGAVGALPFLLLPAPPASSPSPPPGLPAEPSATAPTASMERNRTPAGGARHVGGHRRGVWRGWQRR